MKNLFNLFQTSRLDEVIFENRNKAYGAYAMRQEYNQTLSKSLFAGAAFFAMVTITPFVVSNFLSKDIVDVAPVLPDRDLLDVTEVILPPKDEITKPLTATHIKTVTAPTFKPVRDVSKDQPIPTVKDRDDAAIGPVTQDGPATDIHYTPSVSPTPTVPTTPAPTVPVDKPMDPNAIVTTVDVSANFKGGIDAFRERVGQNFDTSSINQSGVLSTLVTFVVEKDGSITNIKAAGGDKDFNKEAERAIKSIKTKWTPAKYKDEIERAHV